MQQQYGFVQQPCTRCGTTVWISPQAGMGICPSCHTQNALQAAPGVAMPAGGGYMKSSFGMGKIVAAVGAILFFLVVSVGGWWAKSFFLGGGGKGKVNYSALGIDPKAPDGDKMMTAITGLATKWKSDATWWSVNYQAVHADGTVVLDRGAEVQFVSLNKVQSASKKVREDSIKKFSFGPSTVDYSKRWDATNQWKSVTAPALPACNIKQLVGKLGPKGLTGSKTVRVTYDPQFQRTAEQAWHVIGEDPKVDAWYSMTNCNELAP